MSQPIGDHLAPHLPASGCVLELASGSGQLIVALAARFPALTWIPSERDPNALASIASWREGSGLANLSSPRRLDVRERPWPVDGADVMLAVRLVHLLAPHELTTMFAQARTAGVRRAIVIGPLAAHPGSKPSIPDHLAAWSVPIQIHTRDELAGAASAGGMAWVHDEPVEDDRLIVFEA